MSTTRREHGVIHGIADVKNARATSRLEGMARPGIRNSAIEIRGCVA
jgi:hypothetical protein